MSGSIKVASYAEAAVKISGAILGILYVIGLLVSNLQFMRLGIADFSTLNVRYVMTGVLFVIYSLCLAVPLAYIAYWFSTFFKMTGKDLSMHRVVRAFLGFLFMAISSFSAAMLVGSVIGSAYPWDLSLNKLIDAGPEWPASYVQMQMAVRQFLEAYGHSEIFFGGFFLTMWLMLVVIVIQEKFSKEKDQRYIYPRDKNATILALSITGLPTFTLLLVGFANNAYPNMSYNLGGGQPNIANIELREISDNLAKLFDVAPCMQTNAPLCGASIGPLVIWYQSDKFIYVSKLPSIRAEDKPNKASRGHISTQLIAVDTDSVRAFEYLPHYIKVRGGSLIENVSR